MQCVGMPSAGVAPRRGIGASARLAETMVACRAIKVSLAQPAVDVDANARLLESWGVVESTSCGRPAAVHEAAHGSAPPAWPGSQWPPAASPPAQEHATGTNTDFLSHAADAPAGTVDAPQQLTSVGMSIDEARRLTARIKVGMA